MAIGKNGPDGVMVSYGEGYAIPVGGGPTILPQATDPVYTATALTVIDLQSMKWGQLPFTALTGIELRYKAVSQDQVSDKVLEDTLKKLGIKHDHNIKNVSDPINQTLATLSIDIDPESKTFGDELIEAGGKYVFSRADGKDLNEKHVRALEAFVKDFTDPSLHPETVKLGKKGWVASITPTFKDFFAKYAEEKGWQGVVGPFEVPEGTYYGLNVCGGCGLKEKQDGGDLLRCSRCKKQRYCSLDCAKASWKSHKEGCRKP